ncbi:hypothetical protein ACOJ98_001741, partial [Escherichia coli]
LVAIIAGRMLTQPRNSDDIFSLPQCDFDGLIFHPIKSSFYVFFTLSVRNTAILLCRCNIVQGMLFTP